MSDRDPTQQGGQVEPQPTVNPRNAALAQLAQQAHARLSDELQGFNEESGEIEAKEVKPEPAKAKVEASPEPEVEQEQEQKPEPSAPKMLTIIVDGTPIEVEESRILEAGKRTLQKDQAADRRLQEAAQIKRQAEELYAKAQRLSPDAAPSNQAPSQDAPQQQKQATNGLDPQALDSYINSKLYARDAEKAAAKFREDFPEIANDPYLMNMAASLESQRLETVAALGEGPGDPFEAYRKHGEKVKEWMQKLSGNTVVVAPDKAERKRTITAIPAVNARAPSTATPKVLTNDERIEEMRARRAAGGRPINQRLQ